jgi:hypothetical protein
VQEKAAQKDPSESEKSAKTKRDWPGIQVLSLDLRSLAALRIAYGFILFCDTVVRWTDLRAHYSDFGVLPRQKLLETAWNEHWFSLHMATGSLGWLHLLFFLQALFALALLVGWQTRLMTFLSWLFLISVQARNPLVLNGGDIYLRCIIFWMFFLPWGHRWSFDAAKGEGDFRPWMPAAKGNFLEGIAPVGVALQIASVYWFAALPKHDPSWTVNYSATSLALRLDQFVTPIGYFLRDHLSGQLAILTFLVIMWEAFGPFLLFFPFDRGQTRTAAVFGFMVMHIGFGTMMELGFFAWIGTLSIICLLPSWFWDVPARRIGSWLDGKFGVGQPVSGPPWAIYPRELFFLALIVYCFNWNLNNEKLTPRLRMPQGINWIGHVTRLDQRWNMFSPGPLTEDGWYVIRGEFRDGKVLDIFPAGGQPLTWEKPEDVAHTYKNQRWRKYMMNLWLAENERFRLPFGQYLCRLWNRKGRRPDELTGFEIFYMLEVTNLDSTEAEPEKRSIWRHWCFEKPGTIHNPTDPPL